MTCIFQLWGDDDAGVCKRPTGHPDNLYCPRCRKTQLDSLAKQISRLDFKRRDLLRQQRNVLAEDHRT